MLVCIPFKYALDGGSEPARLISSKQLTPRKLPLRDLAIDDSGLFAFAVSDEKVCFPIVVNYPHSRGPIYVTMLH